MSTLIDLHCEWLAVACSESTVNDRRRLLLYADQRLPHGIDNAHTTEIARLMGNRTWTAWTRNAYWRHLNGYFTWGVEAGELTCNPMSSLRCPPEGERLPSPVETDTLAYLLDCLDTNPTWNRPWRLAILLAAYEGLRVSDIATLVRQDITEDRLRIRNGKGGKDAYLITHPLVWAAVADLPAGPVVRDRRGRTMTGDQITNRAWYFFRRFGLPGTHMHQLRHWHATALLEAGADLETVRQCMRHKSITSTVGYTRIVSARRRDAVLALPVVGHEPAVTRLVSDAAEAA